MATSNTAVTTAWTKLADDTDDPVLIQCLSDVTWECAAVATETAPTVVGHQLRGSELVITRDNIGAGFLYARVTSAVTAMFVVTL
jgi:hypothetical protein